MVMNPFSIETLSLAKLMIRRHHKCFKKYIKLVYTLPTGILVFEKPCGVVVGVREESQKVTLFVNGKLANVGKKICHFIFLFVHG